MCVFAFLAQAVLFPTVALRLQGAVGPDETLAVRLASALEAFPMDRAPGHAGHGAARDWISNRIRGLGLPVQEHPELWEGRSGGVVISLETSIAGTSADPGLVLVTAHYDAVPGSPGADDNGSGCVVLVELAEQLIRSPAAGEVRLLWFDGEERGLLGSQRYAAALTPAERARIRGVINLECVGHVRWERGSQRLPAGVKAVFDPGDVGDFILIVGNLDSRAVLERVAAAFRLVWSGPTRVESFGWVPGKGWVLPDIRRSDHAAFWDVGLPAVLVTDTANFRNPHYHRSSDRIETLDLEFLAAVTRGVEQAVRELSSR